MTRGWGGVARREFDQAGEVDWRNELGIKDDSRRGLRQTEASELETVDALKIG